MGLNPLDLSDMECVNELFQRGLGLGPLLVGGT